MWSQCSGDVFTLVAHDCCDARFEIFERFDWPLHGLSGVVVKLA
jgi:hypothetical protein